MIVLMLLACSLSEGPSVPVATDSATVAPIQRGENKIEPIPVELQIHVSVSSESQLIEEGPGCPGEELYTEQDLESLRPRQEVYAPPVENSEQPTESEEEEDVICVGCNDNVEEEPQNESARVDVKINPVTGEIEYVIRDLEIDL